METKRDYLINHLRKCERESISLASHCSLVWQYWRGLVRTKTLHLKQTSAARAIRTGGIVYRLPLRHFLRTKAVGLVLLSLAVLSMFAHQIFFDFWSREHDVCRLLGFTVHQCTVKGGFCFVNWFYYWATINWCVALIVGTTGGMLFVPINKSLAFIPLALFHAVGWVWLIHYSFLVRANEAVFAIPHWNLIVLGVAFFIAIALCAPYLVYYFNHRFQAIEKRMGTLYRGTDVLDGDTFKEQYRKFYEEKKEFQKQF